MLFAADSFCDGVHGADGSGSATQADQTRLIFAALALLGSVQRVPTASKSDAQAVHGGITTWVCVAITASVLLGQGASADASCSNGAKCSSGQYCRGFSDTASQVCSDTRSQAPFCEVVFGDVDPTADIRLTIDVANTDFLDADEYISTVTAGPGSVVLGSQFLVYGAVDNNCQSYSRILNSVLVPSEAFGAGNLTIRVQTSSAVGHWTCSKQTLLATVEISQDIPECMSCPAGFYTTELNATACTACPPGKFLPVEGSSAESDCIVCAKGHYSSLPGSTSNSTCIACPDNSWAIDAGSNEISDCTCNSGHAGAVTYAEISETAPVAFEDQQSTGTLATSIDGQAESTIVELQSAIPGLDLDEYIKTPAGEYMKVIQMSNDLLTLTVERNGAPPGLLRGSTGAAAAGATVTLAEGGIDTNATVLMLGSVLNHLGVGDYVKSAGGEYMKVLSIDNGGKQLTVDRGGSPRGLVAGAAVTATAGELVTLVKGALQCNACIAGKYRNTSGPSGNLSSCTDCEPGKIVSQRERDRDKDRQTDRQTDRQRRK